MPLSKDHSLGAGAVAYQAIDQPEEQPYYMDASSCPSCFSLDSEPGYSLGKHGGWLSSGWASVPTCDTEAPGPCLVQLRLSSHLGNDSADKHVSPLSVSFLSLLNENKSFKKHSLSEGWLCGISS